MATNATITKEGLKLKADLTLTAEIIERVIASKAAWDDDAGKFRPPIWCRNRTSALRGVLATVTQEGTLNFTQTAREGYWRNYFSKDEALAALAVGRAERRRWFPELGD